MTPELLAAISLITLALAVSAVLLAWVAIRRSRQRLDSDLQQRLDAFQHVLEDTDRRLHTLERQENLDAPHQGRAGSLRAAEIAGMAQQGIDSVEIARRTGIDVGEVELTVNLHQPRTRKA